MSIPNSRNTSSKHFVDGCNRVAEYVITTNKRKNKLREMSIPNSRNTSSKHFVDGCNRVAEYVINTNKRKNKLL